MRVLSDWSVHYHCSRRNLNTPRREKKDQKNHEVLFFHAQLTNNAQQYEHSGQSQYRLHLKPTHKNHRLAHCLRVEFFCSCNRKPCQKALHSCQNWQNPFPSIVRSTSTPYQPPTINEIIFSCSDAWSAGYIGRQIT